MAKRLGWGERSYNRELNDVPPDRGCELWPSSCLTCPFDVCFEDLSQRYIRTKRNEMILVERRAGRTHKELAQMFGVHLKTIERILRENRKGCNGR